MNTKKGRIQLMYSDYRASAEHLERLREIAPQYKLQEVSSPEEAVDAAGDTVAVMGHRFLRQVLPFAQCLRWVQVSSAGYDHLPWQEVNARGAMLTTADFAGQVIAQHAVMLAFAMNRSLKECIAMQELGKWGKSLYSELPSRFHTAMVFGLGSIGKRVAGMLSAGGITVWGLSRSNREIPGVSRHFVDEAWKEIIGQVDLLVICLPSTPSTIKFSDSEVVDKLKSSAVVVNVGRGETIDLDAMINRLKAGTLGGVAIDVTPSRVPIVESSDLWNVPGLLITPYLAARYGDRGRDLEKYVESQVALWVSGKPLNGIVSFEQ